MQFNSLVFPKCKSSLPLSQLFGKMIFVPRDRSEWGLTAPFVSSSSITMLYKMPPEQFAKYGSYKGSCIPCLYIPCSRPTSKILVYFHGNAEDVCSSVSWLTNLAKYLHIHVLAMEYKGYGLYSGSPSAKAVLEDADTIYKYLNTGLRFSTDDIILFGRSIGSGPACYLASKYNPNSLVLMSAFTSIRAVAKEYVGSLLQYLVADRFNNKECLSKVKCPVLMLHGKSDNIVPCVHSVEMSKLVKGYCKLHISEAMGHNSMDFIEDVLKPLRLFHTEIKLSTKPAGSQEGLLAFPLKAFNKPK